MARPKDKEEIILNAAYEVYAEKGFKAASMQDIANRAGLGKGTLYEYFKTKDELFLAGVRQKSETGVEQIQAITQSGEPFVRKLESMISHTQELIRNTDFVFKSVIAGDLFGLRAETEAQLREFLMSMRTRHVGNYRAILEQGRQEGLLRDVDLDFAADIAAELVAAYLHLQMFKGSMEGPEAPEPPERLSGKLAEMILYGIMKDGIPQSTEIGPEVRV